MGNKEYKIIKVEDLEEFLIRDIREPNLEAIRENIDKNGFNDSRVLSVIPHLEKEGKYIVCDGNHRLRVIREKGLVEVPCVIYNNGDPYKISVEGNIAEDTYAPLDVFDWMGMILEMKKEGLTQKQIGEKIGWNKDKVKLYNAVLMKGSEILDFAKSFQIGRDLSKGSNDRLFNFTEGWFRNSGLYALKPKYQREYIENFKADKCNWSSIKCNKESKKYVQWQEFIQISENELVNQDDFSSLIELIEKNTFKSEYALKEKIKDFNKKAKSKIILGDALIELENLEDNSIDIIITDPPQGIDYESHMSEYKHGIATDIGAESIKGNSLEEILEIFNKCCEVLLRKLKKDAHIYVFGNWKTQRFFVDILNNYFKVKNIIIWNKESFGAGDLDYGYGFQYETIIYAILGKKPINKRTGDLFSVKRSLNKIHPHQKPIELIKKLLDVSAKKLDTVCDPFMGSGSIIKAVVEYGDLNHIGIELDKKWFEKAKVYINDGK